MVKVKLAKFQGPIAPPRYQEPAQLVQDVPPLNMRMLFASGMGDWADMIAEECDADRLEVSS